MLLLKIKSLIFLRYLKKKCVLTILNNLSLNFYFIKIIFIFFFYQIRNKIAKHFISFTSDCWSKRVKKDYKAITLTSQYIDENFQIFKWILSVTRIEDSKSLTIVKIWKEIFKKFQIDEKNLIGIVTDGGSDMLAAGKTFSNAYWCVNHRIHLFCKKLIENCPILKVINK